jgi:hypothetical protein
LIIEHPTKSNSKISKKLELDVQCQKVGFLLDVNWIIGLDWTKKYNPIIQLKSYKNQTFSDF